MYIFKAIKNETYAYLMTIAAYNTGIGNVFKAFTGRTIISPALRKANSICLLNKLTVN